MSEKQQFDPNGTGLYEAKFKLIGNVRSYSRVVSSFLPGEGKESDPFEVILIKDVLLVNGKFEGGGKYIFHSLHESLRKVFTDGFYTNHHGVIKEFEQPRGPWWLEIHQIDWAPIAFKHNTSEKVLEA